MKLEEIFVVAYGRTAIGSFQGCFGEISAVDLAAKCIEGVFDKFQLGNLKEQVEECIVGNVYSAGLGQAVANQIAQKAGFPSSTNCFTVGKVCSSGMKAVMLGAQSISTGQSDFVVCVGTESMSNVPHLLRGRNTQGKYGNRTLEDCLIVDGLSDATSGKSMGNITEEMAQKEGISRSIQDSYTISSYERALCAQREGVFDQEIIPVNGHAVDEEPAKFKREKISLLKPAFSTDGTITAASSSKLSDGAAVVVLASKKFCLKYAKLAIAQIIDFAEATQVSISDKCSYCFALESGQVWNFSLFGDF
jgi:acetyl-CoA C-acetyltransferase